MLVAPVIFLEPNMMGGILIYAFAAATLGGITSPFGAVGGFLVGVIENLAGVSAFHRHRAEADRGAPHHRGHCSSGRAASSATLSCKAGLTCRAAGPWVSGCCSWSPSSSPSSSAAFGCSTTQVCVYAMVLLGLNLPDRYNGQISLGHGAFYALGAYTMAIMIDRWGGYGWTIPAACSCRLPVWDSGTCSRASTWRWRPSPWRWRCPRS